MARYRTWREHYRIAEKLLTDAHHIADNPKQPLTDRDHAFIAMVQIHATLATAHVDQAQIDQWQAEDEDHWASIKAAAALERAEQTTS